MRNLIKRHTICDIICHAHELGYEHFLNKEDAAVLAEVLYVQTYAKYGITVMLNVKEIIKDFKSDSINEFDIVELYRQEIIKQITKELEVLRWEKITQVSSPQIC